MSKPPRQTVRKKIRINEEKSILGTSCPTASAVGERPACSALSLLGEKVFAHETREEATILLPEFFGQIHSLFRQNGYSYGVAVCCVALKISSASLLPTDREHLPGSQQWLSWNPKSWDAETSTYSLLVFGIRGSLPGAGFLLTSAAPLIPSSSVGYHPVSYSIQALSTTGGF